MTNEEAERWYAFIFHVARRRGRYIKEDKVQDVMLELLELEHKGKVLYSPKSGRRDPEYPESEEKKKKTREDALWKSFTVDFSWFNEEDIHDDYQKVYTARLPEGLIDRIGRLPLREAFIINSLIDGASAAQIAGGLGISRGGMSKILQKVWKHLRG